jgi:hypothetical protein
MFMSSVAGIAFGPGTVKPRDSLSTKLVEQMAVHCGRVCNFVVILCCPSPSVETKYFSAQIVRPGELDKETAVAVPVPSKGKSGTTTAGSPSSLSRSGESCNEITIAAPAFSKHRSDTTTAGSFSFVVPEHWPLGEAEVEAALVLPTS